MMYVRTWSLVRQLCRENRSKIQLKRSYIYDFDPRQCNQAVPASSSKS